MRASDLDAVTALLGREPRGFQVVVRDRGGEPVVISNPPILDDSTPMPTRFWLVGRDVSIAVSRLESVGGVPPATPVRRRPAASVARDGESSACMPISPGTWPVGRIRWAPLWQSDSASIGTTSSSCPELWSPPADLPAP
jgi:hypothetical protein